MHRGLKIFDARMFYITFGDDDNGDQIALVAHIPHLEPEKGGRVAVVALDKVVQVQGGQGKSFRLLEGSMEAEFKKRIGAMPAPPKEPPSPPRELDVPAGEVFSPQGGQ